MQKKTILIFIDWFLPGYKAGGPIQSIVNFIEHLSGKFIFKIITTDTDYLEEKPYAGIEQNKWTNFKEDVYIYYFSKEALSGESLKKLIKKTDFDTAYINGIYSYFFSILPLQILKNDLTKKIIVAARGMLSDHAFSSKSLKKKLFLGYAKTANLYKNVTFQATSPTEVSEITNIIKKCKGVIHLSNFPKKISPKKSIITKVKNEVILVSIARISIEKNTLFALQVLGNEKYTGKITFNIYGGIYNQNYWEECKNLIKKLPKNITVNYYGAIESNKVSEKFSAAHFAFMPSKGENFGHSILESMQAATPVIISDRTPWLNLEQKKAGWDISLNNIAKFANIIQYCIDIDQVEYNNLAKNTYYFAVKSSDSEQKVKDYTQLFGNE